LDGFTRITFGNACGIEESNICHFGDYLEVWKNKLEKNLIVVSRVFAIKDKA
jgi:hypothetical protein